MWEAKTISLSTLEGPFSTIAKCRGSLSVHPMVRDEGFAISLTSNGMRISWRGRVFESEGDAIRIADAMLLSGIDWADAFCEVMPQTVRDTLDRIYKDEDDDVFLPYDVISAPPSACIAN